MESKTLKTMIDSIVTKAAAYADAYNDGTASQAELKALKKTAIEAVNTYNLTLSKLTYKEWAAQGDAIKTAIRTMYIPHAQKLTFKVSDDNRCTVVLSEAAYEVNLPQMQATLGTGVFHRPDWFAMTEKLLYIVANKLHSRLATGTMFNLNIADAAKVFDFGNTNPKSEKGCIAAIQQVFDAICYIEDKKTGENVITARIEEDEDGDEYCKAWTYIRECMTKYGNKPGIVEVCNTGKFTSFILHAMNITLTTGEYATRIEDYTMPSENADENSAE